MNQFRPVHDVAIRNEMLAEKNAARLSEHNTPMQARSAYVAAFLFDADYAVPPKALFREDAAMRQPFYIEAQIAYSWYAEEKKPERVWKTDGRQPKA